MSKEVSRVRKILKLKNIPVVEEKSGLKSFKRPDQIKVFISNSDNALEKLLNDFRVYAPTEDFLMAFTAVRGLQAAISYMAIHGNKEQRDLIQVRVDNFLAQGHRMLKSAKKLGNRKRRQVCA